MINEIALDTNIVIAFLNNDENIIETLNDITDIYLPITVVGELIFGTINSNRVKKNSLKLQGFIDSCEILNINELIANEYASIRLQLKQIGRPIPENDIWIAATCKVNNIPLITRDKHLTYVENLEVITI